jgi:hypothetical protein
MNLRLFRYTFIFLTSLTPLFVHAACTPWSILENPTSTNDAPLVQTSVGNYLYIGGYQASPASTVWRLEKRDKSTGALVSAFGTSGVVSSGTLEECPRFMSMVLLSM